MDCILKREKREMRQIVSQYYVHENYLFKEVAKRSHGQRL
jgi:hypothetical protein